jgi:HEAT repeat protein
MLVRTFKRLFGGPPNTYDLGQRQDTVGLLAALGHKLAWVRRDAAETLGTLNVEAARGPLTAALNDNDAEVRAAAHTALAQLNDPPGGARPAHRGSVERDCWSSVRC